MAEASSFDLDETDTMVRGLRLRWDDEKTQNNIDHNRAVDKEDHRDDDDDQKKNMPTTIAVESPTRLAVKKKELLEELEAMLNPGESSHVNTFGNGGVANEELKQTMRKALETENVNLSIDEAHCGEGTKRMYSREVMEALRFANMEEQRKMWKHALTELDPVGEVDIDILARSKNHKEIQISCDNQQSIGKKNESATILVNEIVKTHCGEGTKKNYSREVMEALRFVNVKEKRQLWKSVFNGLDPVVQKEYINLASSKHHKKIGKKEESPTTLKNIPEAHSKDKGNGLSSLERTETDAACSSVVGDEDKNPIVEGDYSEDDDSDEDYASIQRPAFAVKGEPNFDSGPPEDGLEYLRRVRWEAAQIPKVRVAKLDRSKLNKEQSEYMPKIPEIAKCPEQLLPMKPWEDAFLEDFSQLRLVLSHLENSRDLLSESSPHQLSGDIILESSEKSRTKVQSDQSRECLSSENADDWLPKLSVDDDNSVSSESEKSTPKSIVNENCSNYPLLSVILKMDSVARVSMLKRRISSFGGMNTLPREDCLWLFALCAVIDTPLDADTSASLRSLLRKSAELLAGKSETDDEVVMLNILATISGRYFGQLES
ncbi:uncharacterized protein LOC133801723 [Humulus lupulus]|uniref:uncharacterized protein LOC133801723 n=1 Tax=Humulus lupulus TaxID=3486 RepID=UPI002B40D7E2|nr:uncharacterized protein LOC133801723 [Humulus lupulus]